MKYAALILSLCILLTSCGEHAAKGAGEGAAVGAVYGGAVGATAGAMTGSRVDAKIEEQRKARAEKIREKIGDDAFKGLSALVTCDHQDALQDADKAKQSNNPNFSLSGHWLELLIYADQGNTSIVNQLISPVVVKDWEIDNVTQARANLLELQGSLMSIREEYSLPAKCN